MKKKELLKGTPMKPTKKMVEMSRETMKAERWNKASITVPKFAWFYRARKIEDILEIDIFTNESIKLEAKKPVYRVFLEKSGEYATYDYRTGHWRKSTIEKLEYGESDSYYYMIQTPYMEKKKPTWLQHLQEMILQSQEALFRSGKTQKGVEKKQMKLTKRWRLFRNNQKILKTGY